MLMDFGSSCRCSAMGIDVRPHTSWHPSSRCLSEAVKAMLGPLPKFHKHHRAWNPLWGTWFPIESLTHSSLVVLKFRRIISLCWVRGEVAHTPSLSSALNQQGILPLGCGQWFNSFWYSWTRSCLYQQRRSWCLFTVWIYIDVEVWVGVVSSWCLWLVHIFVLLRSGRCLKSPWWVGVSVDIKWKMFEISLVGGCVSGYEVKGVRNLLSRWVCPSVSSDLLN